MLAFGQENLSSEGIMDQPLRPPFKPEDPPESPYNLEVAETYNVRWSENREAYVDAANIPVYDRYGELCS